MLISNLKNLTYLIQKKWTNKKIISNSDSRKKSWKVPIFVALYLPTGVRLLNIFFGFKNIVSLCTHVYEILNFVRYKTSEKMFSILNPDPYPDSLCVGTVPTAESWSALMFHSYQNKANYSDLVWNFWMYIDPTEKGSLSNRAGSGFANCIWSGTFGTYLSTYLRYGAGTLDWIWMIGTFR